VCAVLTVPQRYASNPTLAIADRRVPSHRYVHRTRMIYNCYYYDLCRFIHCDHDCGARVRSNH
jgi:hypothetical protein